MVLRLCVLIIDPYILSLDLNSEFSFQSELRPIQPDFLNYSMENTLCNF